MRKLLPLVLFTVAGISACKVHVRVIRTRPEVISSALRPHVDSFAMLMGERQVATMVMTLQREGNEWLFTERTGAEGRVSQRTDAWLSDDGSVRRVFQVANSRQGVDTIEVQYRDGRVSGRKSSASGGARVVSTIDQQVPPGTWDDNTAFSQMATLGDLAVARSQSVFSAGTATVYTWKFAPGAIEEIDVPAGRVRARRLEVSGGQLPVTFWFEEAAPHRVVRIAPAGAPIRFDRVR